jgi:hypothetical protein
MRLINLDIPFPGLASIIAHLASRISITHTTNYYCELECGSKKFRLVTLTLVVPEVIYVGCAEYNFYTADRTLILTLICNRESRTINLEHRELIALAGQRTLLLSRGYYVTELNRSPLYVLLLWKALQILDLDISVKSFAELLKNIRLNCAILVHAFARDVFFQETTFGNSIFP